ncbi:MAG: glycosyltransferase [Actinomycetota bacterium]|nr:glycosyltransferase [Actinomycetota bacterium]
MPTEKPSSILAAARRSVPSISVVICTYTEDRWDDILAAVGSVRAQRVQPHEIIIVVDHNAILRERLKSALPDVVIVENRYARGLSGGKNTGVAVASGDLVAFLDDDAVAESQWLRFLAAAYDDDSVIGAGGLTRPLWETHRPAWFPEEFDWVVGCTFVGREPGRVRNLLGGNASFRREVFDVAGGFSNHLGRSAATRRPLGCEETEFCIRASRLCPGSTFVFDARAVIWHRVPATRSRFSYFRSRCYAEGLSKAHVTRSVGVRDGLSAERSYTAVTLRRGVSRGLAGALRGDPSALFRAAAITVGLLSATAGYAVGAVRGELDDLRASGTSQ